MKTHEEDASSVEEARGQRVLIIDDDVASLGIISDYLKDSGFVVLVARNGKSGIERARYAQPDIIFLDVSMPGIDGFETCRRLKSNPATVDIPVIFMTASTDIEDKVKGFGAGAVDYVTKPFQSREILLRARMQLRLSTLTRELVKHEKLAVLGQLTAMVSHELRNPLGVIGTSAYYLKGNVKDSAEKIRKHLRRIDEQVDICNTIVDDLLELTRRRHADMVEGDLHAWLEEVLDQTTIPEQVSLVRKLSPGLPMVTFDRDKLQRVVINLVNNAIQAVIERQERCQEEEGPYRPQVNLATSIIEDDVCIEVEDNGIGMDAETARRAFEPLFTTKARGSGLGLAIVQKIVEEHGGSISLQSGLDRGTKAIVMIPGSNQSGD